MKQDKFKFATVYRNDKHNELCIQFSDAVTVAFDLLCNGRLSSKEMTRKDFTRFLKQNNFKFCHREIWT